MSEWFDLFLFLRKLSGPPPAVSKELAFSQAFGSIIAAEAPVSLLLQKWTFSTVPYVFPEITNFDAWLANHRGQ
jgi:hypothetical protein